MTGSKNYLYFLNFQNTSSIEKFVGFTNLSITVYLQLSKLLHTNTWKYLKLFLYKDLTFWQIPISLAASDFLKKHFRTFKTRISKTSRWITQSLAHLSLFTASHSPPFACKPNKTVKHTQTVHLL